MIKVGLFFISVFSKVHFPVLDLSGYGLTSYLKHDSKELCFGIATGKIDERSSRLHRLRS